MTPPEGRGGAGAQRWDRRRYRRAAWWALLALGAAVLTVSYVLDRAGAPPTALLAVDVGALAALCVLAWVLTGR